MKIRSISTMAVAAASLAACDGLNDALTAHTEVASRAADQELSVTRLGDLLGNSTLQIQVNRDVAMIVTDLWMNYQMLGAAAARGDSLNDPKAIDEAMRGVVGNIKLRQLMQKIGPTLQRD